MGKKDRAKRDAQRSRRNFAPQTSERDASGDYAQSAREFDTSQNWIRRLFRNWRWAETLQLILVVMGIVYAVLTYQQIKLTRASIEITSQQVRTGQRAYVILNDVQVRRPLDGPDPGVLVVLKNTGLTPATKVRVVKFFVIQDNLPLEPPGFPQMPPAFGSEIGAGDVMPDVIAVTPVDAKGFDTPLTSDQVALIKAGKKVLFLFGQVTYADLFGVTAGSTTNFCSYYDPRTQAFMRCLLHNSLS